jgi:hypothetical protein
MYVCVFNCCKIASALKAFPQCRHELEKLKQCNKIIQNFWKIQNGGVAQWTSHPA